MNCYSNVEIIILSFICGCFGSIVNQIITQILKKAGEK